MGARKPFFWSTLVRCGRSNPKVSAITITQMIGKSHPERESSSVITFEFEGDICIHVRLQNRSIWVESLQKSYTSCLLYPCAQHTNTLERGWKSDTSLRNIWIALCTRILYIKNRRWCPFNASAFIRFTLSWQMARWVPPNPEHESLAPQVIAK